MPAFHIDKNFSERKIIMRTSKEKHDELISKLELELKNYYKQSANEEYLHKLFYKAKLHGIMEDIMSVFNYEKFSDNLIDKMLEKDNLLENIAENFYLGEDGVLDLAKKNVYDFIKIDL